MLIVIVGLLFAPLLGKGWVSEQWLYLCSASIAAGIVASPSRWQVKALLVAMCLGVNINNVPTTSPDYFIASQYEKVCLISTLGIVCAALFVPRRFFKFEGAFIALGLASLWNNYHTITGLKFMLPISAIICGSMLQGRWHLAALALAVILALISDSSTVFLVAAAAIFIPLIQNRLVGIKTITALSSLTLLIGNYYIKNFTGNSDRWRMYPFLIEKWIDWGPPWTGLFGLGGAAFKPWGVALHHIYDIPSLYLWGHSDWLEIAIELGVTGLLGACAFFVWAVLDTWRRSPEICRGILLIGVAMVTYMPLSYEISIVLSIAILRILADPISN